MPAITFDKRFIIGTNCYSDDETCDTGLSSGAKAGIGVGVVVAFFAIVALSIWACCRCRRQRRTTPTDITPTIHAPVQQPAAPRMSYNQGTSGYGAQNAAGTGYTQYGRANDPNGYKV